jgi:hypothetical protein
MGCQWKPGRELTDQITSFDQWKKKIKPRYYENPDFRRSLQRVDRFKDEDFASFLRMSYLPSGFVILDVKNDTVTAEIHTNDSGKPVRKIVMKGN